MDWNITETNMLSLQDIDRRSNKLLIGNGYIGYRGTLEEFTKEQKTATIVSGLYDKVGDLWREPVNLPNGGFVQVTYQGESFHAMNGNVVNHIQSVDMKNAIHERKTIFEAADGTHITIHSRRFASLARRHFICMEYSISADRECEVDIRTGIDGDVWDINGPHLEKLTASERDNILSVTACTHESAVPVAVSEVVAGIEQTSSMEFYSYTDETGKEKENPTIIRIIRCVHIQESFTFYKFFSLVTGLDTSSPLEKSRQLCQQATRLGFNVLLAEHTALWQQRWEACDIQIEGDPTAQQALRFSLYHLLSIVPTHTERASIPARGMSGQMYKGAVFWDTEIFMLPFFTYVFPTLARNLLLYRYHTLAGAYRKAREYGFRGAFYAWESQDTGDDACTLFNVTDIFTNRPVRTYFRDKQIHISADIPYAFWQYYTVTGDESIWQEGGAQVVFECARFFLSYLYYSPDKRRYEILDVTGADEYHERIHNNAFTNRMVYHTFKICMNVAKNLHETAPDFYRKLMDSLEFETDLALISNIAPNIFQPDAITPGNLIPQFDGYFALEDIPLETLLKRRLHPNEYLGGGNGLATTTQIIKQADVVLMLYLFGDQYNFETKTANWEYYEPRTEHGSSLSACSYSIIAAQLGKADWAYKYFLNTATIDLNGNGKQYAGSLYIGGTHPAGSGGAWMSVVFGLCGVHFAGDVISINPHIPDCWNNVTLPFFFHDQGLRITITHESVTIRRINSFEKGLSISVDGFNYPMDDITELTIPLAEVPSRK